MISNTFQILKVAVYSDMPSTFPSHVCYYIMDEGKYYIYKDSLIQETFISFSLPAHIEYDETDKTLWSNGPGNDDSNTTYGLHALRANTTGARNTAIGTDSLNKTNGDNNTGVGAYSLFNNVTGVQNTAIGHQALNFNTVSNNTAIGCSALYSNTTGENLVAVGYNSMVSNTTGSYNTAVGQNSLEDNTTGNLNTAVGYFSLKSSSTTSSYNVAIGSETLTNHNGINGFNTAVGAGSMYLSTDSAANSAFGSGSLANITTGQYNVAIGCNALQGTLTTGVDNTAIGVNAGMDGNYSGSVMIGKDATATGNNQMVIGSPTVPAGAVTTESLTVTKAWKVKINGVDYKIPLQLA